VVAGAETGQQRRVISCQLQAQLRTGIEQRLLPKRPGWRLAASETPIQPLVIGGNAEVLAAAQALDAQGLWVSAIRAPTVPAGTARLRITLSAAHTSEDVARLLAALQQLAFAA